MGVIANRLKSSLDHLIGRQEELDQELAETRQAVREAIEQLDRSLEALGGEQDEEIIWIG